KAHVITMANNKTTKPQGFQHTRPNSQCSEDRRSGKSTTISLDMARRRKSDQQAMALQASCGEDDPIDEASNEEQEQFSNVAHR
ncbi:hypothetical protein SLS62_011409, partial [Diatrype stigma]